MASSSLAPITASRVTLCCIGSEANCRITLNNGEDEDSLATLAVSGNSLTMSNISVFGGAVGLPRGQLTITGGGNHLIDRSTFEDSMSGSAAVYVETTGSLLVRNSEFTSSSSTGLYIMNASRVRIDTSIFSSNLFEGIVTIWDTNRSADSATEGQDIEITNSIFTNNGFYGLLATNLGTRPRVSITLSSFTLNGNAGSTFCCASDYEILILSGNSGFGNISPDCDGFVFFGLNGSGNDLCLPFEAEVS